MTSACALLFTPAASAVCRATGVDSTVCTGNGYQKGFKFLVMIPAMVSVCGTVHFDRLVRTAAELASLVLSVLSAVRTQALPNLKGGGLHHTS